MADATPVKDNAAPVTDQIGKGSSPSVGSSAAVASPSGDVVPPDAPVAAAMSGEADSTEKEEAVPPSPVAEGGSNRTSSGNVVDTPVATAVGQVADSKTSTGGTPAPVTDKVVAQSFSEEDSKRIAAAEETSNGGESVVVGEKVDEEDGVLNSGDQVVVIGLEKHPDYNNKNGTVLNFVENEGRYRVQLSTDDILKVKRTNLIKKVAVPTNTTAPQSRRKSSTEMISSAGQSLGRFMLDTRRTATKYSVIGSRISTIGSNLLGKATKKMDPETATLYNSCVALHNALEKLEAQVTKFKDATEEMCTSATGIASLCRSLAEGDAVSTADTDKYRAAVQGIAATSGESEPPTSIDILRDGLGKVLNKVVHDMTEVKKCIATLQDREVMEVDLRGLVKEVAFMRQHTYTKEETDAKAEALKKAQENYEQLSNNVLQEATRLQATANTKFHNLFEQFRECQLRMFSAAALSLGDNAVKA